MINKNINELLDEVLDLDLEKIESLLCSIASNRSDIYLEYITSEQYDVDKIQELKDSDCSFLNVEAIE